MRYEVTVKPGSKQSEVKIDSENIVIRTTKRAHDGEANAAVVELLAKHFRMSKGSIKILRGEKSRKKVVLKLK